LVEAAAWLHDIGYAPDLVNTGFHALDGARYLRDVHGADERLCRLVAHHSCAVFEAEQRGLLDVLQGEFPQEQTELRQGLTYCDMTTGPDGSPLEVAERLAEILSRYGADHLVSRSISNATPCITSDVQTVQDRLANVRSGGTGEVVADPQSR
jgi:hypothetical protein